MHDYHITPKAPLMFRDSKPFGAAERAETLSFPLPSTVAGAFRTIWGDSQEFDFNKNVEELLKIPIAGPLLTLKDQRGTPNVLFPTPADSLCLEENQLQKVYRLSPAKNHQYNPANEGMDLPFPSLMPVFLNIHCKGKPSIDPPRFWYQQALIDWLKDKPKDELDANKLGVKGLPVEIRTHVAISNRTLTNRSGILYQSSGLDFSEQKLPTPRNGWSTQQFGLLARCGKKLPDTYRTIGGEARLGFIEQQAGSWPQFPEKDLAGVFANSAGIRLILVTPAIFDHGMLPSWLDSQLEGSPPQCAAIKLRLAAVALPRWQPVSGWAMASAGGFPPGARPIRRMAPAGSVYWFHIIEGQGDVTELKKLWLTSISDQQPFDGFGLTVPGHWSTSNEQ